MQNLIVLIEKKRQEEKNNSEERYPWLDDADERKYMMDKRDIG